MSLVHCPRSIDARAVDKAREERSESIGQLLHSRCWRVGNAPNTDKVWQVLQSSLVADVRFGMEVMCPQLLQSSNERAFRRERGAKSARPKQLWQSTEVSFGALESDDT